jgi:hypothetical protein
VAAAEILRNIPFGVALHETSGETSAQAIAIVLNETYILAQAPVVSVYGDMLLEVLLDVTFGNRTLESFTVAQASETVARILDKQDTIAHATAEKAVAVINTLMHQALSDLQLQASVSHALEALLKAMSRRMVSGSTMTVAANTNGLCSASTNATACDMIVTVYRESSQMDMILPLTHGASVNLSAIPRRYLASASVIEAWSVTYTYNRFVALGGPQLDLNVGIQNVTLFAVHQQRKLEKLHIHGLSDSERLEIPVAHINPAGYVNYTQAYCAHYIENLASWSPNGVSLVRPTSMTANGPPVHHTTCRTSHLTAFSVLQPELHQSPLPEDPKPVRNAMAWYWVLVIVGSGVAVLAVLILIVWLCTREGMPCYGEEVTRVKQLDHKDSSLGAGRKGTDATVTVEKQLENAEAPPEREEGVMAANPLHPPPAPALTPGSAGTPALSGTRVVVDLNKADEVHEQGCGQ